MATLAELLAKAKPKIQKPEVKPISDEIISDDLVFLTTEKEVTKDEPIAYMAGKHSIPRDDLYINLHVPFLLNPFKFNINTYRQYKQWLLYPTYFVLNTFAISRYDSLRNCILKYYLPNNTMDLHNLFMMLSEFELTVPAQFEYSFIEIIERDSKNRGDLTKIAELGKIEPRPIVTN